MAFRLQIRAPAGGLEKDPDRTEEEERVWREKHPAASEQMVISTHAMSVLRQVLWDAGALWRGSGTEEVVPSRGPLGEVDILKFSSPRGWSLSPSECEHLGRELAAFLRPGPNVDTGGVKYHLTESSEAPHDVIMLRWLIEVSAFLLRAATLGGAKVMEATKRASP